MTEQEAIWVLKDFGKQVSAKADGAYQSTIGKMACDMAISALGKQIPKKPVQGKPYNWIDTVRDRGRYVNVKKQSYQKACPCCGETVLKVTSVSYCRKCGQAIDWSDENER